MKHNLRGVDPRRVYVNEHTPMRRLAAMILASAGGDLTSRRDEHKQAATEFLAGDFAAGLADWVGVNLDRAVDRLTGSE